MSRRLPDLPEVSPPAFAPPPSQRKRKSAKSGPKPSKRKRAGLAVAALASLATAGLVIPNIVSASQGATLPGQAVPEDATLDLERVELGQLASELDRLDLELTVTPATGEWSDLDDWGPDEQPTGSSDAEADGQPADETDPFAGMTDEEIDSLSDDEFFDLLDQAGIDPWGEDAGGFDESDFDDFGDNETPLVTFDVAGDQLANSSATPEQANQANRIWGRFTQLIPANERTMVSKFELMADEYGGAHVYADENDPSKWILGVNFGIDSEELDSILVHEFGHLLTLKASEVPPSDEDTACPTYNPGEGCAMNASTIAEFVEAFWPQQMQDDLARINDTGDWDAIDQFYTDNADQFVTDYAATNPVEDLAETFTAFVLEERPTGTTIATQKVELLWGDPEMVALRDEIRANL